MANNAYARAYTEVLEIISHLPEEEYSKIPVEEIEFYKKNMDKEYRFTINPELDLAKQHISKETNAIIVTLFRDYFATEEQKEKLDILLRQNQEKQDQEKRERYNPDDLFKKVKQDKSKTQDTMEKYLKETKLIKQEEPFFIKFKKFIFRILHIN